ncbi:hypothetical protein AWM70_05995 [Paenibacillus yonginensis]|uniref:Uncharacterized protein n=1 Tax=Paenibacillus yonginensis TaxID=1462996 RepID=A0A1B1MYF2_9BACL|nr:hypothetical protein AWM70_05995 [Paenibacillus yonginensis]
MQQEAMMLFAARYLRLCFAGLEWAPLSVRCGYLTDSDSTDHVIAYLNELVRNKSRLDHVLHS